MRYCRRCHILYSSQAAACPKCGVADSKAKAAESSDSPADNASVRRDWLWILIGVPVLIGVIYFFVKLLNSIG